MKYSESSYQMKHKMSETLRQELIRKSFSKITVSDIVAKCGINRKTFYYHFSDIHALLQWMLSSELCEILGACDRMGGYVLLANDVMDYVERNEAIFHNLINTAGEDVLKKVLYDDILKLQEHVITGFEERYGTRFEEDFRSFLVKFLADAIVGILMEWIRKRRYRDRERTIEYLRDIFQAAISGLIERRNHLSEK
ncbi:MAG: TetR/AcrR family transcriptional regulator C-terminal domain-containing protein [Clostridia bacterium]|nr:TetR/AcrR family transcriptional regulator C-terminal domain-containing protein [Clostridia bacterium]